METAKDKAKSLVEKYSQLVRSAYPKDAIECAKIAVRELIDEWMEIDMLIHTENILLKSKLKYYREVKNELNKM